MCKNTTSKFNSLLQLSEYLNDEKACIEFAESLRWKDGKVHCPHCGMDKIYRYTTRKLYKCASCSNQFSVKVGTVFEKSRLPMKKWILAIYLNGANKKGISSHQLAKEIDVPQKTSWFMLHRIRKTMEQEFSKPLEGVVMIDASHVGGKNANRHRDKKFKYEKHNIDRDFIDKTTVLGFIQPNGYVRCGIIPRSTKEVLYAAVKDQVAIRSTVVTDEHGGFSFLNRRFDHQIVNHAARRYKSDSGYSTNRIEGFWATLKRTIFGVYHYVSKKHLDKYIDEIVFRHNTKDLSQWERFALMMSQINARLTYKTLVYGT